MAGEAEEAAADNQAGMQTSLEIKAIQEIRITIKKETIKEINLNSLCLMRLGDWAKEAVRLFYRLNPSRQNQGDHFLSGERGLCLGLGGESNGASGILQGGRHVAEDRFDCIDKPSGVRFFFFLDHLPFQYFFK